ncbi:MULTISPECIES: ABC transporter ATP-binding protein [Rhizobium]|uniref:Sn-glycerol-3-phosphate ABC transporter ATP-binding protein UgpC n=1 Tax=Rhizobium rhododendri TaxID=2506430 RepID=A0ABY8IPE3_9HYPH|nr:MULTISPECIES: sn-glycerol-3-phosphate ABC transporter ATP-binding protein UgpC [Rhizobium]MBO9101588.1 sn-glycerol-3-phosphate ABC transporter ATP-binding protein UgpC [Rhizobium sp. L58/93]MBO9134751.1 sn-glycerol-3-phosphate ABC transporter ATP-binding protein UgpC [Rhizobium sp. B209b/85]MBO9170568.1 sn-glycerol-3-phosphate ABC transporter ATP-binding protein UgpC [Rhizobium sp. L245/93]MBO9187581.1 sn-glycerol-3-phosphate ABC transporter ATP-binding protein UgpC [Rhizobium sp. E27B/91]M
MASIDIQNVRKAYGHVQVLHDVDLQIEDGEFIVLVGPSGCGKSTLLRMIAGLEDVTGGEIRIAGRRVNELHPKDRDIAMVFQSYALYPHMNVAGNMSYSLKIRKIAKEKIAAAVSLASSKLGLDPLLERRPKALSGGQRQRVAMGRAIVREPKAFLFDEPLSNLDARLREQMRAEIKKLHADLKATSIYVTHDQIEAMTLADRIVAMHGGVVQQVGSPLELYDRPANLFVAGFIGSPGMNFLEASYDGHQMILGDGTPVPLASTPIVTTGEKATLGIRPEHVVVTRNGSGISADVDLIEPTGFGIILHLKLHGLPFKIFTLDRETMSMGPKVSVAFPTQHLHVFDGEGNRAT